MPRLSTVWYKENGKLPIEVDVLYFLGERAYYYQRHDNRRMSQPFKTQHEATLAFNSGKLVWDN